RLYLYVLAETTDLLPEQLAMSYWFVPPWPVAGADGPDPTPPRCINLPYSQQEHQRTAQDLDRLTDRLTSLLATAQDFPQVDEALGHCLRCPFAVRCQRSSDRYATLTTLELPPIEAIAEVPL
ncbi:MAG TPA: PD-(D/E)XK nuclease family protein, partial [Leptolyngbyaceae cyanobacterium M65_K2018_010]|nr:PD-(D/E)XK nuclease family protein [Leptolyngbyaceae cyanobacterium M65_K2018_010]